MSLLALIVEESQIVVAGNAMLAFFGCDTGHTKRLSPHTLEISFEKRYCLVEVLYSAASSFVAFVEILKGMAIVSRRLRPTVAMSAPNR